MAQNKNNKAYWIVGGIAGATILYLLWRKFIRKDEKQVLKDAFENLNFEFAKTIIKEESYPFLDELADVLKKEPTWTLKAVGYTDNKGSDKFNLELSKGRSLAVQRYLISKGVDENRIISEGYGKANPIADNSTPEGQAKNRRVELYILKPNEVVKK
jgi:OOP family OmpA-OmpF porin